MWNSTTRDNPIVFVNFFSHQTVLPHRSLCTRAQLLCFSASARKKSRYSIRKEMHIHDHSPSQQSRAGCGSLGGQEQGGTAVNKWNFPKLKNVLLQTRSKQKTKSVLDVKIVHSQKKSLFTFVEVLKIVVEGFENAFIFSISWQFPFPNWIVLEFLSEHDLYF